MKFEVLSLSLAKQEITFTSHNGKICHILLHYTFYNVKSQSFIFLTEKYIGVSKLRIKNARESRFGNKRPNFCGVPLKIALGEGFEVI